MAKENRVNVSEVLESQIPEFLLQDAPTFTSFLKEYYRSLETRGGATDLATNLKEYKNIEAFYIDNLIPYTALTADANIIDDTINVLSTRGWPDKNGLLKIDDEIIHYKTKTSTTFEGCTRGFSGINEIEKPADRAFLSFSLTESDDHTAGSLVVNLSNLFLREFFTKFKAEFLPGFENREFYPGLDIQNILTRAKDFYRSKGTDTSYKILFKVLYGSDIEVVKPQDYMLVPSSNNYFVTKNLLLEKVSGANPLLIKGSDLYQNLSGIGTVTSAIYNVEYRPIDDKEFYEISLDSENFNNLFQVTGKTRLLENVQPGSTTMLVDSTIGFSQSGNVFIKPEGYTEYIKITYTDKTTNQFLGCSGITEELEFGLSVVEDKFAFSYVGFGQTSRVDFLISNIVDTVDFSKTSNLKVDDKVTLSGFGKDLRDVSEFNGWVYNVPTNHTIDKVGQVDTNKYLVNLIDRIDFYLGQKVNLVNKINQVCEGTIVDINYDTGDDRRKYSREVVVQVLSQTYDPVQSIALSKTLLKGKHYSNYFQDIGNIPTGVQNTYVDGNDDFFYVTSSGLPNYEVFADDTAKEISLTGITTSEVLTSVNHKFYDGESVYMMPNDSVVSGIDTGYYYVESLTKDTLSLAYSKADLFGKKFIKLNPVGGIGTVYRNSYENKTVKNQKILKKFNLKRSKTFFDDKNRRSTSNRQVGILANGVEILSPTLFDENVYYGRLDSIEVTNQGEDYDVINPPELDILDSQGSGCKAHVNLSGAVKEVKVIRSGIGYSKKPEIKITGGNGSGCVLESNLVKTRVVLQFKPTQPGIDIGANTINLSVNHNFQIGEEVIYNNNKNNNVGGLVGDSHYYVSIVDNTTVKLHSSSLDAISGINTVNITGISSGFHALETLTVKNTISTIYVKEAGEGYSNRAVTVPSVISYGQKAGINTYDSFVLARGHGFSDGEIVTYSTTDTVIAGLDTTSKYFVHVLDPDRFRVVSAGINTVNDENLKLNKYVKFVDAGIGTHTFAYPPIKIEINATNESGDIDIVPPVLEPKVLGFIEDVYIEDGGVSYGCTSQFNYHRRPIVQPKAITSKALIAPIIVDGSIVDVKIINKGNGYRLDSDILVEGDGSFAELVPTIENGRITAVTVINGGAGYNAANTICTVVTRGKNAKFLANVTNWKVNQVKKLEGSISNNDDGYFIPSKNNNLGIQFIHFYAPKKLRYQISDNFTVNDEESSNTKVHSPIIGWAYDGNPIYGPYGFENTDGGGVRRIETSYEVDVDLTPGVRPTSPEFIDGFFINDYKFKGSGDLDQNNGRFCKTPEYPDGTYAYFTSVTVDSTGKSQPVYPYFIGEFFHGQPISENFLPSFNQDIDFNTLDLKRNVAPYYITSTDSEYPLIDKVDEKYKQEFIVSEIRTSGIHSVSIFSSGDGYKVGDSVEIEKRGDTGSGANISVAKVKGKTVSTFNVNESLLENVVFDLKKSNTLIVKTTDPHEILNTEVVSISGISTSSAKVLEGNRSVGVRSKKTKLTSDITVNATGVTTTIYVNDISGFEVNDVIGIGTEICRVIRIDSENSSFAVNRLSYPGIHTARVDDVTLLPNKLELVLESDEIPDEYTFSNQVVYFDPKETVGVGTTGVSRNIIGVGGTIVEYRTIPKGSIYLPGHKFFTGQELKYHVGLAGTSIYINNVGSGTSIAILDGQSVYAVNLGVNYIGLSTIGFTSTTGIGTQLNAAEFVDFTDSFPLVGSAHSLTTIYPEVTGFIERYSVTVGTSTDHQLTSGDRIDFKIDNRESDPIKVLYNPVIRKMTTGKIGFANTDVSTDDDTIDLTGEEIENGDKVVYYSANPISGLNNYQSYFVYKNDYNKIHLSEYPSDVELGKFVDFTSAGGGDQELYKINPPIKFIKGDIIRFDMSDQSVSDMELEFYEDPGFTRRIEIIGRSETGFAITRSGTNGLADAEVSVDTSKENFPTGLYYTLVPKGPVDERKDQITRDVEVKGANKIDLLRHSLNDSYIITTASDDKFIFNLTRKPSESEKRSYNNADTKVSYVTDSKTTDGPIERLRINFAGLGYDRLPVANGLKSDNGKGANIKLISDEIGRVDKYDRIKDGFDYPTDPTLAPSLSTPSVVGIKDIRTIDYIGITTGGRGYNQTPTLVVPDKTSIKLIPHIQGGSIVKVDVAENAIDFSVPLDIVTIHHSQGYDIDFFTVNGNSITAELSNTDILTAGISTVFPFQEGDEVFVEACRLTDETDHLANYNSDAYGYKFFTVTGISTINNTVTYDMTGIATGAFGTYDDAITLGYLVNKKDVPVLEMVLRDDVSYLSKEKVTGPTFIGRVMEGGWDNDLNQLRVNDSFGNLRTGEKLTGESSKVIGTIEYFSTFNLNSTLGVTRDKIGIIDKSTGILNSFQQRISDNFYYQKFSYSIKSQLSYDIWRESVRSLVHPSGFKEFSDYELITEPTIAEVSVGIAKSTDMKPVVADRTSSLLVNIDTVTSFYDRQGFNMVYEEDLLPDGSTQKVYMDGGIPLKSYILSKTNKVVKIDNIDDQFDGSSQQQLNGRYADASDLLDLNRQFIIDEIHAKTIYNYPSLTSDPFYDETEFKSKTGRVLDAVSSDLKYDANNETVGVAFTYWDAGSFVGVNTVETVYGYNYMRFLGQYVINNQTPPTYYQSTTPQLFNLSITQDPYNQNFILNHDSRDLIVENKREILDKSLASIAIPYPNFIFPGSSANDEQNRYAIGYKLIKENEQQIIDESYAAAVANYPLIANDEPKAKLALTRFIDAIATDLFTGGNRYSRLETLRYFAGVYPDTNALIVGAGEQNYMFEQAKGRMRKAVRNGLGVTFAASEGPSIFGVGSDVSNTNIEACQDVQNTVITLSAMVTGPIGVATLQSLPQENLGTYSTGAAKCFRDLKYIVDGVAQDIAYDSNQHTVRNTKFYFDAQGNQKTDGLVYEEAESIYIFRSAMDYMKKAVRNELRVQDRTIVPASAIGVDTNTYTTQIQTDIESLVGILTVAIGNSSLSSIPTVGFGTGDCADVRFSLRNYVGIVTNIIGIGTDQAPSIITEPSLKKGGIIVGLSTFKLTNKGTPLFRRTFDPSDATTLSLVDDQFTLVNHNFQTGQELIYDPMGGTRIGIATTSYISGDKDILMNVGNARGTSVLNNGIGQPIDPITGVSTVVVPTPAVNLTKYYNDVVGTGNTNGTNCIVDVIVVHSSVDGVAISTTASLVRGGENFGVGETVTIGGTYFAGTNGVNDFTFTVTALGPTVIQTEANNSYTNLLGDTSGVGTDATFSVSRNDTGVITDVDVILGGSGYASTSIISIAGTAIGGVSPDDDITVSPTELGRNTLPNQVFVYKESDSQFKLTGLTTSLFFDITSGGIGTAMFTLKDPNPNTSIAIDGIVQNQLRRKNLQITLGSSIGINTDIVQVAAGINSVVAGDIINANNEYILIKTVGVLADDLLQVEREYLGTTAAAHDVGVAATIVNGDYNIVGDTIFFTTPPYGKIGPVGLETGSTFNGRFFSRQINSDLPQDRNVVFDDISLAFTGIAATEFTLKVNDATTTAVYNNVNKSTDINNNPFVFINNVFQRPRRDFDIDGSTANTIRFLTGTPSAGRISKVAITTGFGYMSPIAAAGIASVGTGMGGISTVISTNIDNKTCLAFNPDGSRVIIGDNSSEKFFEGTMTTAFAIDTIAGFTSTTILGETDIHGVVFGPNGTDIFYTGGSSNTIKQVTLSTPYDYTTNVGVATNAIDQSTLNTIKGSTYTPRGLGISSTGNYIYALDEEGILQIKLDTPFVVSSANAGLSTFIEVDNVSGFAGGPTLNSPRGISFAHSGSTMFLCDADLDIVLEYGLTTPEDVTTASLKQYKSSTGTGIQEVVFIKNRIYTADSDTDILYAFDYTGIPGTIYDVVQTGAGQGYQFPPLVSAASSIVGTAASIRAVLGAGGTVTSFHVDTIGEGYNGGIARLLVTEPTGYSNLDLHYTGVSTGVGIEATAKVRIGSGSSIIDFNIDDHGRGYKVGDVLKAPDLIQDPSLSGSFEEFQIEVKEVQTDKFAGFYPGQFILFDDFSNKFNGFRKKFTLTVTENGVSDIISLRTEQGSDLNVENNLFIYINDILQEPKKAYTFRGSRVIFTEAPKPNSKCTVMFFRGSSLDVVTVIPPKTIKRGDTVIIKENRKDPLDRDQFERVVQRINSSDEFDTFSYASVGIDTNPANVRPLTWKKQEHDRIINGSPISKSRPGLSGKILPTAKVINNVGPTDTAIYVDNAFPIFTEIDLLSEDDRNIMIVEEKETRPAIATAIVSSASTISEIIISDGGVGYAYTDNPVVTISRSAIVKQDLINAWSSTAGVGTTQTTWKSVDSNSINDGGVTIAVGDSSRYAFTTNPDYWFDGSIGYGGTIVFNGVGAGGTNIYIAVGEYGIVSKTTGYGQTIDTNWTAIDLIEERFEPVTREFTLESSSYGEKGNTFNSIVYSPYLDNWAAVGTAGSVFGAAGINSTSFRSRFSGTIQELNDVIATPAGMIAVGNNGTIVSSTDNVVWTTSPRVTNQNLNAIVYHDGIYVAAGTQGTVLKGTNFANIVPVTTNVSTNFVSIDFQGFYVALEENGNVWYSFDLESWIQRPVSEANGNDINSLVFVPDYRPNGKYIAVGAGSTIIFADQELNRTTAQSSVTAGVVTSITVVNDGFGYSQDNPPSVLIESPIIKREKIDSIKAEGDFGVIIGIQTFVAGTPGIGTTSPMIKFVLESEQYNNSTLGVGYSSLNTFGVTYSQLSAGDYFVIHDSNVETGQDLVGITTLDGLNGMANYPQSLVGIAKSFIDGVYRVDHVTAANSGIVTVTCHFQEQGYQVSGPYIQVYRRGESDTGINTNGYYGRYSWSRIYDFRNRIFGNPKQFTVDREYGLIGINSGPTIYRTRSV